MTVLKMGIAIMMVLFLSVLAEMVSPRFAGIFSGYPLGAAINLFFIGIEISPEFASESALYAALGLIATQVFAYGYLQLSVRLRRPNGIGPIVAASLTGIGGYFAAAAVLRLIPVNLVTAILFPTLSILAFNHLFRGLKNLRIQNRVGLKPQVLLFRSAFAAGAIILITSTARLAGPRWAGLFSAFPITMLPFVAIIHFSYGAEYASTVLKNVPRGLSSLVVYSVAVSVFYRTHGVYVGTAMAYGLATLCLVVMQWTSSRRSEAGSPEDRHTDP
ncbi:MAG: hypothetical protein AB9873_14800 [Syntrophobacteraceae bacterium]